MTTFGRALPQLTCRLIAVAALGFCATGSATVANAQATDGQPVPAEALQPAHAEALQPANAEERPCERALRAQVADRGWSLHWETLDQLGAPSVVDYTEAQRREAAATIALVVTPTRAHVDARFLSHREERRIAIASDGAEDRGCAMLTATLASHDTQRQRRQRYLWVAAIAALISTASAARARAITKRLA